MKIALSNLMDKNVVELHVHSYEPDIYLAKVKVADEIFQVTDEQGHLIKERSQLGLKKHFKGLGIRSTKLFHESTYDEMIGTPVSSGLTMAVSISNPDDDLS